MSFSPLDMLYVKYGCWGSNCCQSSRAGYLLPRSIEWTWDVECMGRWTIWVSEKDDCQISEMNGEDGSAIAIDRGGNNVHQCHWIFSGQIRRSSSDEVARVFNKRG